MAERGEFRERYRGGDRERDYGRERDYEREQDYERGRESDDDEDEIAALSSKLKNLSVIDNKIDQLTEEIKKIRLVADTVTVIRTPDANDVLFVKLFGKDLRDRVKKYTYSVAAREDSKIQDELYNRILARILNELDETSLTTSIPALDNIREKIEQYLKDSFETLFIPRSSSYEARIDKVERKSKTEGVDFREVFQEEFRHEIEHEKSIIKFAATTISKESGTKTSSKLSLASHHGPAGFFKRRTMK